MAKTAGVTLALLLLLLAVALGWSLYPEQPNLTGNTGYEERASDYRAGGPDCQPQEIDRLPSGERSRRAVTCREAEEQYRLEANDLIQQRRSADAADATAVLTYQQTGIASWGLALGFITMAAAIAAAFYARDAAKHTKTANDITIEGPFHFTWEMFEVSKDKMKRLLIQRHEGRLEQAQIAITGTGIGDAT